MYSLELAIDAGVKAVKAFRAVKRFDSTVIIGTTLHLMRERKPLDIYLDCADRIDILRRLVNLLDELDRLEIAYEVSANNVPRSSQLWKPKTWKRSDVVAELAAAEIVAEERRQAGERMRDCVPPEPPPSRAVLDQRWREKEFSDLLPSEQNYIYIWAMQAEVNDGGFDAFFFNSSGDDALQTQAALKNIGSQDVYAILSDAINRLGTAGGYSTDRAARWRIASQLEDDAFTDLNRRFYGTAEDVVGMAFRVVELDYASNGLV